MTPVTFDFETFWSTEFSLSKIPFMEYIMSPQFEAISVSIKVGNGPTNVYVGDKVAEALKAIDWTDKMAIAHNGNEFDFPLLVWRYDVHPKMFVDTLAMAKAKYQSDVGGSLKALSARFGLPTKDNSILASTKGRYLKDFTAAEIAEMERYNKVDTDNTYQLFLKMFKDTPKVEFQLMDMTARMIIYPQFVCDTDLLKTTLASAETIKEAQLQDIAPMLGLMTADEVRTELGSAVKFAAALEALGIDPPMKISKTTGKPAYAFAKTDEEFSALLEHDDERVQVLASARLGVKSTLLETRLATMMSCAEWMGGWMPVPLAYHAATTGRWGGRVWNPQNLPRINPKVTKLTDSLRKSLCAPDGHMVVVSDLSGIELRVNHYLWDVQSTQALYDGDPEADLYKEFAAALFGIDKAQVTKEQRQLAKVAQLGLGFGAGAATFKKVAKIMGGLDLDDAEAERVKNAWRMKYRDIVQGWAKCQKLIEAMYSDSSYSPDPRGLVQAGDSFCTLPSGRRLYYPNLHMGQNEKGKPQYKYGTGRKESKVYSGLMDENLVQAIARDVIAEQALTIKKATGMHPALMVHDELVYVVKESVAQQHLDYVNSVLRTPPSWLPGIVLWSEGDTAANYGSAK